MFSHRVRSQAAIIKYILQKTKRSPVLDLPNSKHCSSCLWNKIWTTSVFVLNFLCQYFYSKAIQVKTSLNDLFYQAILSTLKPTRTCFITAIYFKLSQQYQYKIKSFTSDFNTRVNSCGTNQESLPVDGILCGSTCLDS